MRHFIAFAKKFLDMLDRVSLYDLGEIQNPLIPKPQDMFCKIARNTLKGNQAFDPAAMSDKNAAYAFLIKIKVDRTC